MEFINLKSDTVTEPTQQMRDALLTQNYGNIDQDQDSFVLQLQNKAAQLLARQSAAFVPTGVMGNQCTMLTVGKPGQQVVCAESCHLVRYQNGSLGLLSKMMAKTLPTDKDGFIQPETLRSIIKSKKDFQNPKTTILELQNPTSGGRIYPQQRIKQLLSIAKQQGWHTHLDGARIFHAVIATGKDVKELTQGFDTVMFCLSKGLSTALGSIVVGSKQFIQKFKQNRKRLGGAISKSGGFAQCGKIALENIQNFVGKANNSAQILAKQLSKFNWIQIVKKVEINMIFFVLDQKINTNKLHKYLLSKKIKTYLDKTPGAIQRFVAHHYIGQNQISKIIETFRQFQQISKDLIDNESSFILLPSERIAAYNSETQKVKILSLRGHDFIISKTGTKFGLIRQKKVSKHQLQLFSQTPQLQSFFNKKAQCFTFDDQDNLIVSDKFGDIYKASEEHPIYLNSNLGIPAFMHHISVSQQGSNIKKQYILLGDQYNKIKIYNYLNIHEIVSIWYVVKCIPLQFVILDQNRAVILIKYENKDQLKQSYRIYQIFFSDLEKEDFPGKLIYEQKSENLNRQGYQPCSIIAHYGESIFYYTRLHQKSIELIQFKTQGKKSTFQVVKKQSIQIEQKSSHDLNYISGAFVKQTKQLILSYGKYYDSETENQNIIQNQNELDFSKTEGNRIKKIKINQNECILKYSDKVQ